MEQIQLDTCDRYGAKLSPPEGMLNLGISASALH
jgi:hypothetical protein